MLLFLASTVNVGCAPSTVGSLEAYESTTDNLLRHHLSGRREKIIIGMIIRSFT